MFVVVVVLLLSFWLLLCVDKTGADKIVVCKGDEDLFESLDNGGAGGALAQGSLPMMTVDDA